MLKNMLPKKITNKLEVRQRVVEGEYIQIKDRGAKMPPDIDVDKMEKFARVLRGLIFASVEAGQSGHPGSSSKTEQFLALTLSNILAFNPLLPKNPGRDRVVWSAGHCTPLLFAGQALYYEVLRRTGRQFSEAVVKPVFPEHLIRFRHADGPQGHAESSFPFSDVTTGPSGHGFSAAVGLALSHRGAGLDTKIWVFMGDAESEEGLTYEARNLAAANGLKNLIVSLDYNHFGIDEEIEQVIASPYANHWRGLGWNVIEVDGHNLPQLINAYHLAARGFENNSPTMVLCHTRKGKGYGSLENTAASHGTPVGHEEYVQIMKKLGFDIAGNKNDVMSDIEVVLQEITSEDEIYIAQQLEKGAQKISTEHQLVSKIKTSLAKRPIINPLHIKRPEILPPELVFKPGEKVATRTAAQAWMNWFMKQTAFFYVGAGDLARSVYTNTAENVYGLINRQNPYGRGIRFGIAEQNMAMAGAGMTQDILPGGFQPVCMFGTFAVFTTMMGNAIRLAAIGNQLNPELKGFFIALASHDGPETGEDGPTHQGMYWMSLYNALPGVKVYKPLDANETIEMLFGALEKGEPIILSVSRPAVPVIARGAAGVPEAKEANNGAYVYRNFSGKGQKVILAVSGSYLLHNTMAIVPELEKQRLDIKIVAVTSPELFAELRKTNPDKAAAIFSDEDRKSAITLHNGWPGFLHPFLLPSQYEKRAIGITSYLKSGTVEEVYDLARLSPQDIKEKILRAI